MGGAPAPLQTGGNDIYSKKEAKPLEEAIQRLFGETSYQVIRTPCRGKYRGHSDYSLEFGSGRRLYIGIDQRNYVPKLREHLGYIRYFREHQAENTEKIKAVLASNDTPYRDAALEIVPYDGTMDLNVYAVVILTHQSGLKIRYRTTNLHYVLVAGDNIMNTFDSCMEHLLQDACGDMSYCTVHNTSAFERKFAKQLKHKQEETAR